MKLIIFLFLVMIYHISFGNKYLETKIKEGIKENITSYFSSTRDDLNFLFDHDPHRGNTPLILAIIFDRTEIVKSIINKIDPCLKNKFGATPLFIATAHKNLDIMMILLDSRADPNQPSYQNVKAGGVTPLWVAVNNNLEAGVRLLLSFHADVNTPNYLEENKTPFWIACSHASPEIARLLLVHHADPDITTYEGETPLDAASMRPNGLPIVELLLPVIKFNGYSKEKLEQLIKEASCPNIKQLLRVKTDALYPQLK